MPHSVCLTSIWWKYSLNGGIIKRVGRELVCISLVYDEQVYAWLVYHEKILQMMALKV